MVLSWTKIREDKRDNRLQAKERKRRKGVLVLFALFLKAVHVITLLEESSSSETPFSMDTLFTYQVAVKHKRME